jgi:hypothetical protein
MSRAGPMAFFSMSLDSRSITTVGACDCVQTKVFVYDGWAMAANPMMQSTMGAEHFAVSLYHANRSTNAHREDQDMSETAFHEPSEDLLFLHGACGLDAALETEHDNVLAILQNAF